MKVFVDTNVLISAILFPRGKAGTVFSHVIETHDLVLSSYSISECDLVFQRKFPDKIGLLRDFLSALSFELVTTPDSIDPAEYPDIRDAKDLPILASAIISDSDIILTGDRDFEGLAMDKPLIFTPARYSELLTAKPKK
jgi:putative PIN family toxin of toxin-antitoxin system